MITHALIDFLPLDQETSSPVSCCQQSRGKRNIGKLAACVCCPSMEDSDIGSHYTSATKDYDPSPRVSTVVSKLEDMARQEVTLAAFEARKQPLSPDFLHGSPPTCPGSTLLDDSKTEEAVNSSPPIQDAGETYHASTLTG